MSNPNVTHVEKSVFSILNTDHEPIGYGFFIDPHGTALTCNHLIAHLTTIRIRDYYGTEFIATINQYHTQYSTTASDIAVLQIPTHSPTFLLLPLTESIDKEMTVIEVHNGHFTFEDILYHQVNDPRHPPSFHGLPITITGTIMAVGLLSVSDFRSQPLLAIFHETTKSVQLALLFQYFSDKYCPGTFHPEHSTLKTICNAQVQYAVRTLTEQKIFLPDLYCNEKRFESKLKAFKDDAESILCLLGESGSGKTNCLVRELPHYTRKFFTLYFSAQDFEIPVTSLPGKIKKVLSNTHDPITAENIMQLIYQHPTRCCIIIDGLNKMPRISSKTFDEWFLRSIHWARGLGLKLIITSTQLPSLQNAFHFDGFTDERIKMAINAYQLPEKFVKISRLNHPLLLRLLHDTGSQQLSAPLDDYPLLTKYLSRKCTTIAARNSISSQLIHSSLIKIAQHFVANNDYWISNDTYHHILRDYPHLSSILLEENLFLQSTNGIRITHNWLADFLIGETFSIDADIDPEQFISSIQRKGLSWLLVKKSFLGQDISIHLQNLLTLILQKAGDQSHIIKIFSKTVRHLSHPDKYYPIIESFAMHTKQKDVVGPMVYNSHLSYPNQLKLIKIALSSEKIPPVSKLREYLGPKYYEGYNYLESATLPDTKQILQRYIRTAYTKTIETIMEWLYDYQEQDEIPAINIIAGILILQYTKRVRFPFHTRKEDTPAQARLIKIMVSLLLLSEVGMATLVHKEMIKQNGNKSIRFETVDQYIKAIPPFVLIVYRSLPLDEYKMEFTMWLLRIGEYRHEMISEIMFLFKEGKATERMSGHIRFYITQEGIFEILVPMLVKYIKYGSLYTVRKKIIPIVFKFGQNKEQNNVLANHLAALIRRGSDFDLYFTRRLTLGLYFLPALSAAYQVLADVIPVLLLREIQSWYRIIKYLCREEKNTHKRADKIKWIEWGFENLPAQPRYTLVVKVLNMKVIKDEEKIREMIKPTILFTLKESRQFYEAVLKKAAKKSATLYEALVNDEDFKV